MGLKKIIVCDKCGTINKADSELIQEKTPTCGKCSNELSTTANVISIGESKLEKIIRHAELPVVIDAYASWCGPCKVYGPIFSEVAKAQWKRAEFFKMDIEQNSHFAAKNGIRGVPTTLIYYQGKLVTNQSGLLQKEVLESLINKMP